MDHAKYLDEAYRRMKAGIRPEDYESGRVVLFDEHRKSDDRPCDTEPPEIVA